MESSKTRHSFNFLGTPINPLHTITFTIDPKEYASVMLRLGSIILRRGKTRSTFRTLSIILLALAFVWFSLKAYHGYILPLLLPSSALVDFDVFYIDVVPVLLGFICLNAVMNSWKRARYVSQLREIAPTGDAIVSLYSEGVIAQQGTFFLGGHWDEISEIHDLKTRIELHFGAAAIFIPKRALGNHPEGAIIKEFLFRQGKGTGNSTDIHP